MGDFPMPRLLTPAAIIRFKPAKRRREISDGGARGLRLTIEPSGTKSWTWRYRHPSGTSAVLRLGRVDFSGREHDGEVRIGDPLTLAAARALAAELERQRLRGRDPAAEHQLEKRQRRVVASERESNLFPAAVRMFSDEHVVARKGRRPRNWRWRARCLGLAYSEDGGEPTIVPKSLAERWQARAVTEITSHDVYLAIDEARRHGIPGMGRLNAGLSDERARKMRAALSALFGFLLEHRKVVSNPTTGIWRPPPPAARTRTLNTDPKVRQADELRWFWAATDSIGEPIAAALKLLLLTGQRLREIGEMQWDELSDDLAVLHLSGERTKNSREHRVPMSRLAQSILRNVPKIENCGFVFSTTGRPTGSWNRIKRRLDERMFELAREERGGGATIPAWVLHDLRRSCASGMQQIGVRTEVIERALNHASGVFRSVSGVYQVDPLTDDVRVALERWARHIESIVTGKAAKVVDLDSKRRA
jgi:integrase